MRGGIVVRVDDNAGPFATVDRVANVVVMVLPLALVGLAASLTWGGALRWPDLIVLATTYLLTGLGITVGFHRLLTHRSFKTSPALREELADEQHYAKDLLADPVVRFVDRTFVLWVLVGLAFPFGLGVALTGSIAGGLTALLWGGAVRMFLLHHATFSINSLCHFFGRRSYATSDESRNLLWLALPTLGEAWHNNHHAFPTSARHGLRWWQLDPSAWLIAALQHVGLAWDVIQIAPERQREKLAGSL
jgi:fatty-acid desaturase